MNTSIINSSFQYLTNNYELIVKLSIWINEELTISQYNDSKFDSSIKSGYEKTKLIIHIVEDKNLINEALVSICNPDIDPLKETKLMKLLIDNGADTCFKNSRALSHACFYGSYNKVKLLLENGADAHANNDRALRWAYDNRDKKITKLLIQYGANISSFNTLISFNLKGLKFYRKIENKLH
jgi:ankyrin repeat protein